MTSAEDTNDLKIENEIEMIEEGNRKPSKLVLDQRDEKVTRQFLACSVTYLLGMSNGACAGFSAVTIPQLQDPKSGFDLSTEEVSWFASLVTFANILTCIVGGMCGQRFGRKRSMLFFAPLCTLAFLLQALAPNKHFLFLGRFLVGIGGGLISGPGTTFVSEISSPDWRTTFGSGIGVFYLIGLLFIYIIGSFLPWRLVAAISAFFSLAAITAGLLVPETPAWLLSKGYGDEARRALDWLKGTPRDEDSRFFVALVKDRVTNEENVRLNEDSVSSGSTAKNSSDSESALSRLIRVLSRFLDSDVWKPLLIMILLGFSHQFCGLSAISYYAVTLLMNTASSVDEYLATILFGLTRLLSQMFGSGLLLRFKRRHLFVTSGILTGTGMLLLGLSATTPTNLQRSSSGNTSNVTELDDRRSDDSVYNFLPLFSIIISALGYSIGISPITWSYMGELFPLDIRAAMAGLTNCVAYISTFLVIKTYPILADADNLGFSGTMWFYTSVCVLNIFIGIFILPETKGKRLEDINKSFAKKENRDDNFETTSQI